MQSFKNTTWSRGQLDTTHFSKNQQLFDYPWDESLQLGLAFDFRGDWVIRAPPLFGDGVAIVQGRFQGASLGEDLTPMPYLKALSEITTVSTERRGMFCRVFMSLLALNFQPWKWRKGSVKLYLGKSLVKVERHLNGRFKEPLKRSCDDSWWWKYVKLVYNSIMSIVMVLVSPEAKNWVIKMMYFWIPNGELREHQSVESQNHLGTLQ